MTKIDKAVMLAAGRGTRMRELTADLPKPMIEVRGKPVLQHIVEGLRDAGVRQICLLSLAIAPTAVRNFFGDGSRYNVAIQYATQTVQDGTGRVVDLARDFVGDSSIYFEPTATFWSIQRITNAWSIFPTIVEAMSQSRAAKTSSKAALFL